MSRVDWKVVMPQLIRIYGSIDDIPRTEIAKRYGITVSAVSQAIQRWNERYGDVWRRRKKNGVMADDITSLQDHIRALEFRLFLSRRALEECKDEKARLSDEVARLRHALKVCQKKREQDYKKFLKNLL